MAKKERGGKPAILALVDAAWGSSGTSPQEGSLSKGSSGGPQGYDTKPGGKSAKSPGGRLSGGRKGPRKPAPAPPRRR